MYNSVTDPTVADLGSDIPWIKNEELILLRAEIRWFTGDLAGATADLNLIRQHAGGLGAIAQPGSTDAFVDQLLYNRRYSLMWEQGTSWIDARRYDRLGDIPLDRTGDVVHPNMLVPAGECDARGLNVPCTPLP
jgi:hypothetical protein